MNRSTVYKVLIVNISIFFILILSLEFIFKMNTTREVHNSFADYNSIITFNYDAFTAGENALFGPFVSHPFFGHTLSPQRGSNNLGFNSEIDYPYKASNDEFVLGVFGGSVAQGLASYLNTQLSKESLNVCKKTKRVKVLNFALGAYKQPQQFSVFHTFADQVDMAINLDGNNDILHRTQTGYPRFYPTFYSDLYLLTKAKISELQRVYRLQSWQRKLIEWSDRYKFLNKSELYFRFNIAMLKFLQKRVRSSQEILGNMPGPLPSISMEEDDPVSIKLWVKYVKLQNLTAKEFGVPIIFYVQPTQYLENSKIMSDGELKTAIVTDQNEAQRRRLQFRRLVAEVPALKKMGVNISDITKLYKDEAEPIFIDDCCHINNRGYDLLTAKIIADIKSNLSKINCKIK